MKIRTLKTSKDYEWHKHFLWIPKKVRSCKDKNDLHLYGTNPVEYRYEILWLETVERKNVSPMTFDTDD
jgi:hypothetical protein